MPSCEDCTQVFETESMLTLHKKAKHASVSFSLDDTSHVVKGDENGSFLCPCRHHATPTRYHTSNDFVAHIKNVVKWARDPPPEEISCLSRDVLDTPTLRQNCLVINIRYRILICVPCQVAVNVGSVHFHFTNNHKGFRQTVGDRDQIVKISVYLSLPVELPVFSDPTMVQVEGLPLLRGLQCSACPRAYTLLDSLKDHFRLKHPDVHPPKEYAPTDCQQLKRGSNGSYFVVVPLPELPEHPLDDVKSMAKMLVPPLPAPLPASDARNISPWLRVVRWHELLQGRQVDDLFALVQHPTVLEFRHLKPAVLFLMEEASELIDLTPEHLLVDLNTPLPTIKQVSHSFQRLNNTPFHKLQDHYAKLVNYTNPVVDLLAMLLRGPIIPLPADVTDTVCALRESVKKDDPEVSSKHILALLSLIWRREWLPTKEHRISDPTISYLALSTLQRDGQFQEPHLVTNVIARFEYCIRLVFVRLMHSDMFESPEEGSKALKRWYTEKVNSTFNSLLSLQHLATSIAYQTVSLPNVWWLDKPVCKSMLFKGTTLHFTQIQSMIAALEKLTKHIWERDVLFSINLSVQYDLIRDDLSNKSVGYSFLSDPRNECFADNTLLMETVLSIPELKKRFVTFHSGSTLRWNVHALRSWLVTYADFTIKQLLNVHVTGGASSRGTEITAMLLSNTCEYPMRNLVAFGRHLALLVTYLKTSAITGSDKLIPHSLSAFSSDMLIQDLAIARPFARFAAQTCYPNQPEIVGLYNTHVFVNHTTLFTTADITEGLTNISNHHLDFSLNVSSWRHISIAWRRVLSPSLSELVLEDENETVEALQSGHKRRTEDRRYGISADNLAGAAEDVLPLYLDVSTDWQIICGVVPGGLGLPYRSSMMASFANLVEKGIIVRPAQSVEESIHHLVDQRIERLEKKMDVGFAKVFDRLLPQDSSSDTLSFSDLPNWDSLPHSSQPRSPECLGLEKLAEVTNIPNVQWTCEEQKLAFLAISELKTDVLVVMATGSGKTMLIILPALLEKNQITVVVIPLRSILDDYVAKFTRMNVPFEVYKSGQSLSGAANIVLVSADTTERAHFKQALAELNQRVPVVRQVIDECHIPPSQSHFRPALSRMDELRCSFPVQIVCLSATVTVAMEPRIRSTYTMRDDTLVVRTHTNRPELRYVWNKPSPQSDMPQPIRQLIRLHLHKPEDRALVFVPTVNYGQMLQEAIGYDFYVGSLSDADRIKYHQAWEAGGEHAVMISTTAFGTGVDYAHVRLIIHMGTPIEMLSYIQEVSRAGRDKQPALCIVFPSLGGRILPEEADDFAGKRYLQLALAARPTCIRYLITAFVDREGVRCTDSPGNQLCSVCREEKETKQSLKRPCLDSFEPVTQQSKKLRQDRQIIESDYIIEFKRQLARFSGTCTFCLLWGEQSVSPHEIVHCPTLIGAGKKADYLSWKGRIQYGPRKPDERICYICHVPQGKKDSLHSQFTGSRSTCTYPDLIAPLVYAVLLDQVLGMEVSDHFGVTLSDPMQAIPWINSPPVSGQLTNLTALFLHYAKSH